MAIRVAEMLALVPNHLQNVSGPILAQPVAVVRSKPQLLGLRVKRHTYALAYALRVVLEHPLVRVNPHDRCLHIGGHHDIPGRADVEIELAVGTHPEDLPEVAGLLSGVEVVD